MTVIELLQPSPPSTRANARRMRIWAPRLRCASDLSKSLAVAPGLLFEERARAEHVGVCLALLPNLEATRACPRRARPSRGLASPRNALGCAAWLRLERLDPQAPFRHKVGRRIAPRWSCTARAAILDSDTRCGAESLSVPAAGTVLGKRYRVLATIGEGAMGVVFRAQNAVTGKLGG
jgi:hypothetical protein